MATTKKNLTTENIEAAENKEVKTEAKVVRKPNGARAKAPKPAEKPVEKKAVEQPAETSAVEKKAEKAPAKKEKAPNIRADRRALVADAIHLIGDIQFETAETAKKGENSATVINDGALMLTQVKDNKARRVLEIYLHARDPKAILLITKSVYVDINTLDENVPEAKKAFRQAFIKKYGTAVLPPKKGSKLIINLEGDQAVADFANAMMLAM